MTIQPYLMFNGRADEAAAFYKRALGAEVEMLMRFKDAPDMPSGGEGCAGGPPPPAEKVMHMCLKIGDDRIMASDGQCSGEASFQGFSLAYSAKTEAEAKRAFAALGEGGQVQMPLGKTFFSPAFGMVADRFGVSWMVVVEQASVAAAAAE
jgi:PhnB protein